MKRFTAVLLAVAFMFNCIPISAMAEEKVITMQIGSTDVTINNTEEKLSNDEVPTLSGGSTMLPLVPLRSVIEALGGNVEWDGKTKTITIKQDRSENNMNNPNDAKIVTQEWDKTFPQSDKVDHSKVTFKNRYGITLAADMYVPKNAEGKLPAIAVSGPFGAVKEQCSGLYAQTMAERGFLTIAFDPSYTGESGGEPRYMASPDINTEDFMAAVDFLSVQDNVDADKISILGICGWGGMAINAAALDTRIKATVASTMYDISRTSANGYFDADDSEEKRYAAKTALNAERTENFKNNSYVRGGGVVDPLPDDAPQFVKDYYAYYKTDRGYHERSLNSNDGWNTTGTMSFMNQPILQYSNEIRSAVLIMHGEEAHSFYMGKDAYENMTKDSKYADNKEFLAIPGASHTDLYDGGENNVIPFDKIEEFIRKNIE